MNGSSWDSYKEASDEIERLVKRKYKSDSRKDYKVKITKGYDVMTEAEILKYLRVDMLFTSKWFDGEVEVQEIRKDANELRVKIIRNGGENWHFENWNLEHTIVGFRRGDYNLNKCDGYDMPSCDNYATHGRMCVSCYHDALSDHC